MHFKKLEESEGMCISPIFPSGLSSVKSPERASKPSSNCISMAVTSVVSMTVADVLKKSDFVAKMAKPFKKTSKVKSPISPNQLSAVCGMDSIRGYLLADGISQESPELIGQSRRQGTKSHYELTWRKFCGWFYGRKIDPFGCSLAPVLQFLTEQFHEGQ